MMHFILLHAERLPQAWLRYLQLATGDQACVLSLASSIKPQESLLAHLQASGAPAPEIVDPEEHVKAAAREAREKYIKFVAEWPNRYRRNGKSFKELLTFQGQLSLWWLSRTRMKDVESSPTFILLFQLEMLTRVSRGRGPFRLHLISEDRAFRRLVTQWAQGQGIGTNLHPRCLRGRPGIRSSVLGHCLSRLRLVLTVAASVLLVKLVWFVTRPPSTREGTEETVFFTYLDETLQLGPSGLQDRHYVDLPAYLEEHTPLRPLYASFVHGHLAYLLRRLRQLLGRRQQLILLESYLTIGDALGMLFDWRAPARYLFYELFDRRFKASFRYDGLNIYHLIRNELLGSFVGSGIADCLFLAKAFQRMAGRRPIKHVVSFLELYPQALAVYAGVKRGRPQVTTVAYQHAAVTRMKLWYCSAPSEIVPVEQDARWGMDVMPSPDLFLCQGGLGEEVLLESGFPRERCFLTGSPRYDQLGTNPDSAREDPTGKTSLDIPEGKRVVLVPTSYSPKDTEHLVGLVAEACSGNDDWFVVFKPHPVHPMEDFLATVAQYTDFANHVVLDVPIQRLIAHSDVVVTTYSTTADEAIALGCPVVVVRRNASFSMATVWEIEAAPAVDDAQGLQRSLDILFRRPESFDRYRKHWPEFIKSTFYLLDGRAKERVTQVLMAAPAPGRPHQRGGVKAGGRL